MKQELVRTKSKICSLKREMSSIQQLHLAQQHQAHAQLSTPTMISSRVDVEPVTSPRTNHASSPSQTTTPIFDYDAEHAASTRSSRHTKKHSSSSNDGSLSPPALITQPTCSAQSTQTPSRSSPSTISSFANLLTQAPLPTGTQLESSKSPSDEQLRLYLTETLQREKDSTVWKRTKTSGCRVSDVRWEWMNAGHSVYKEIFFVLFVRVSLLFYCTSSFLVIVNRLYGKQSTWSKYT